MEHLIIKLRNKMGLKQYQMAKALNITPSALHNYEKFHRYPKPEIAYRIIDLAKLNGMYLGMDDMYPRRNFK